MRLTRASLLLGALAAPAAVASPHVAGVGALYKGTYGDAPYSTTRSWLINNSTTGVVTGSVTGTPNRLLYKAAL